MVIYVAILPVIQGCEKKADPINQAQKQDTAIVIIGSRATGSEAGCYMVIGPNWKGETPAGIKKIFSSKTQFSLAI